MVDYLTVMLVNMVAGLVALACFVIRGLGGDREAQAAWAAPLGISGLLALLTGLHMSLTWPIPGNFSVAFGESAVLYGVSFLGIALALWRGWELVPVAVYTLFAGVAAIVVGIRVMTLKMTNAPALSGAGFILTGLAAVLLLPAVVRRRASAWRTVLALLLFLSAAIWAFIGYGAIWAHLAAFGK